MNTGTRGMPQNLASQDQYNFVRPPTIEIFDGPYVTKPNAHFVIVATTTSDILLPPAARPGDILWITNASVNPNHVIRRNGHRIMGTTSDVILDVDFHITCFRYISEYIGWIIS